MKTIIEPFRIKTVEPIRMTTREERKSLLSAVHYNLFGLKSQDVIIDLLTDSGTSAMSSEQWAALLRGDESYAGSSSYYRFKEAVTDLMTFQDIIPTHQGRTAERILATVLGGPGKRIPNNTHVDTMRASFETNKSIADNLPLDESFDDDSEHPFKGNIDIAKLENYLAQYHQYVPLVMLTVTNNAGGGQPVSMKNIRDCKRVCEKFNKPLFIDGSRFAENAYLIKLRELGYADKTVKQIVQEMFSYADGMLMGATNDAFANVGGWLALNDSDLAQTCRHQLTITEGTYGGLTGRDLDAIAQGLHEVIDEDYLSYRLQTVQYLSDAFTKLGIPFIKPIGAHAVYIDAKKMLPHIEPLKFPGQALCVALYEVGGIRSCEIGSLVYGKKHNEQEVPAAMELVRLSLPRRVYTQSHYDYIVECFAEINQSKDSICGLEITWQPDFLRHFTAKLKLVDNQ